ncbi:hypothetical protein E2C01_007284 [Portunus trituberculatus]|uniref:Uncharacterized protein n=1 Tax=Portunus trituberculatus TaxID=210409 RepID=A0A5B7D207_PORTR|nr:hypothetical protein [Portunus trituberculatus]
MQSRCIPDLLLYGYPVVVPTQQQQVVVPSQQHPQPSPPPQQHHHNYSKKKKKKYQRRRQVDAQPAGGYLDPQLYTGEPFVATPGGYVVPLESAASVCHIHGIQYVTPAFHQRLPDEGFVSVQHSPYLPDVAADPPTAEAHTPEGTNSQSDTARTVFSDLQDTERQQIQEILQEHNKVSKTDSTESSDSGVSESEEAAAAEASSDELEARQDASPTEVTPEPEDSPDIATDSASSASQCQQDSLTAPVVEDTQPLSIQHNAVTAELCSASVQADAELSVPKESQACQTEESISEDQAPCEEVIVPHVSESLQEEVTCCEYNSGAAPEFITADIERTAPQTEELPASPSPVSQGEDDITNEECSDNTVLAEADEGDDVCEPEISSTCSTIKESSTDTSGRDSEIQILAQETEETLISNTSVIDVAIDNQNSVSSPEITSDTCDELTENPSNECINSSSNIDENVPCKSEGVLLEEENFDAEVNDSETVTLSKESYEERDHISIGRLKELKVTEAVTRWIREVTPEKAFTLSEEVQSRLLAEKESIGEMDTEDEYIEDEMATETKSTTVPEPKNVKGNPFVAPSSESPVMGVDGCSKRVALINKFRGTTPDIIDDYDGSSTISNLSVGNLHSEASSCLASVNQSFDEDVDKYAGNPEMYDPSAYAKYYQLGIEVDEITPTATPPLIGQDSCEATPSGLINSDSVSECGSEDIDSVPHKYEMTQQYTESSPLSLATEILKAEKVINNMVHITGDRESSVIAEQTYGNPDIFLKHYDAISRNEVSDSGVQSEDSSDETEGRSIVSSSGVGSSLASTPAVSPAHNLMGRPPLQPYPLKNLSVGEGPVPCKTVCCAVM